MRDILTQLPEIQRYLSENGNEKKWVQHIVENPDHVDSWQIVNGLLHLATLDERILSLQQVRPEDHAYIQARDLLLAILFQSPGLIQDSGFQYILSAVFDRRAGKMIKDNVAHSIYDGVVRNDFKALFPSLADLVTAVAEGKFSKIRVGSLSDVVHLLSQNPWGIHPALQAILSRLADEEVTQLFRAQNSDIDVLVAADSESWTAVWQEALGIHFSEMDITATEFLDIYFQILEFIAQHDVGISEVVQNFELSGQQYYMMVHGYLYMLDAGTIWDLATSDQGESVRNAAVLLYTYHLQVDQKLEEARCIELVEKIKKLPRERVAGKNPLIAIQELEQSEAHPVAVELVWEEEKLFGNGDVPPVGSDQYVQLLPELIRWAQSKIISGGRVEEMNEEKKRYFLRVLRGIIPESSKKMHKWSLVERCVIAIMCKYDELEWGEGLSDSEEEKFIKDLLVVGAELKHGS